MKKTLLVVSFGTSYHDTCERNITVYGRSLTASCPGRTLLRAFTSETVIHKLQQRDGIHIDTPLQALQKLAEQGYQDVVIQSLHIINGDEYEKIVREVQSPRPCFQRLTLGMPLPSGHGDHVRLMQALYQQIPSLAATERVVFIGHGASHYALMAYACLNHMTVVQGFPTRAGTVKDYLEVDIVISEFSHQGATDTHLMLLILVAGNHAISDMASDGDDSWKTRFSVVGIPATPWLNGLGEDPAARVMFVVHLQQTLSNAMEKAV